ncbi:MAG: DUF2971 domain-containing protein [Pseudomonadota bacterium]
MNHHKRHITTYPVWLEQGADGGLVGMPVDFPGIRVSARVLTSLLVDLQEALETELWEMVEQRQEAPPEPTNMIDLIAGENDKRVLIPVEVCRKYYELPEIIYQYRGFDEHLLHMLHVPYIWFSHPSDFNDPFELPDVVELEWRPDERYRDFEAAYLMARQHPNSWAADYDSPQDMFADLQLNQPAVIDKLLGNKIDSMEKVHNRVGVCCFSRVFDQVLMWSHYSAKHTGVVIGYDLERLKSASDNIVGTDVDYRWHREKLKAGSYAGSFGPEGNGLAYFYRKLATKHPLWAYEQEFRLMALRMIGYVGVPADAIKEIYFGCQVDPVVRKVLLDTTAAMAIPKFDMVKVEPYGLVRRQITV